MFLAEGVYNLVDKTGSSYKKNNKTTHKSYNSSGVRAISSSRGRNQKNIASLFYFQILEKITAAIHNCLKIL